ncbi:MAG: DNA alkylation repair protein [Planktomarina sp.]
MTEISTQSALDLIGATADAAKADQMRAYHKVDRPYLGVGNGALDDLAKTWRQELSLDDRLRLAAALWDSNIHEARICAAKMLTQARIKPDDAPAWDLLQSWVPDFDAWAIADHAMMAAQRRLTWMPERVDTLAAWVASDHMWTRRAAFVATLPWTKQRDPKPQEIAIREQVLDWAAGLTQDHDWFIQKAIAWWLRELSRRDPARVIAFIDAHGQAMKPFAVKEAQRHITKP